MRHKSVGINVTANDTLLTIPSDKKAIIASIHISNKDVTNATVDIKVVKGVDSFYLIKGSTIPSNSLVSVLQDPLFLEYSDEITIEPSVGADLDVIISYKELVIFNQFI